MGLYFISMLVSIQLFKVSDLNNVIDQVLIKEYEGKPFKGISSMCYNQYENLIYFVDGTKFENGQCYPFNDSLYCLDLDTKIVKPILNKCLSHCSDICYDHINKAIYICEPFANRITKAQIHKSGIIFTTIFHQFSGRLGPTSVAVDEFGNIYVSRFEFAVSLI